MQSCNYLVSLAIINGTRFSFDSKLTSQHSSAKFEKRKWVNLQLCKYSSFVRQPITSVMGRHLKDKQELVALSATPSIATDACHMTLKCVYGWSYGQHEMLNYAECGARCVSMLTRILYICLASYVGVQLSASPPTTTRKDAAPVKQLFCHMVRHMYLTNVFTQGTCSMKCGCWAFNATC